ncbi:MAG: glycosyltransferase, partial [bacterium]
MKIAFFSNSYLPYLSGITVSIKTLKDELEKLGHEIFVVGPRYPHSSSSNTLRLPSFPAPYPGYRIVWPYSYKIFKKIKEEKIDVIHAHQPFGVGLAALCLARRMNIPFVYSFHTLFPRYVHNIPLMPKCLAKWLITKYLTWFCNQADIIFVGTEMVRRLLAAWKVKAKIVVMPTGVRVEKVVSSKQNVVGRKTLLYTGRLSKEKNIPFLLAAFPEIEKQEPNIQLFLVGGGPME